MRTSGLGRTGGRISPFALALLAVALLLGTTGGAVAGALVTGAQIKNGTVTGVDIKDGSLTKADTADEPIAWGVQNTTVRDNFNSGSYVPIAVRTLSTPRAGFLTIVGTVYAEDDFDLVGEGNLQIAVRVDGKIHASTRMDYAGLDAEYDGENGVLNVVVPVAKGARKVELVARELGAGSFVTAARATVLYTAVGASTGFAPLARPVTPRVQR